MASPSKIRVTVFGENIHEQKDAAVQKAYPSGMHNAIAKGLRADGDIAATTATLQERDHGLTVKKLAGTDVLIWWGHKGHDLVKDRVVERIVERVWAGMGLIVLHSAHYSKVFKRLMGTACNLRWREAGERERLWITNPRHPIAAGLPPCIELENEEMYGEPFGIPEPLETVMISWFQGGEVFRSGVTYRRGAGNVFYFRPGHETYRTYHNPQIQQVLRNAVRWANCQQPDLAGATDAPNVPAHKAPEKIPAHALNETGAKPAAKAKARTKAKAKSKSAAKRSLK